MDLLPKTGGYGELAGTTDKTGSGGMKVKQAFSLVTTSGTTLSFPSKIDLLKSFISVRSKGGGGVGCVKIQPINMFAAGRLLSGYELTASQADWSVTLDSDSSLSVGIGAGTTGVYIEIVEYDVKVRMSETLNMSASSAAAQKFTLQTPIKDPTKAYISTDSMGVTASRPDGNVVTFYSPNPKVVAHGNMSGSTFLCPVAVLDSKTIELGTCPAGYNGTITARIVEFDY